MRSAAAHALPSRMASGLALTQCCARRAAARRRARGPSPGRATLRISSRRRTHQLRHPFPLPWPTDPRIARPDGGNLRICAGLTSAQHAQWEGLQVRGVKHVHWPAGPWHKKPARVRPHASHAQLRSACQVRQSAPACAPCTAVQNEARGCCMRSVTQPCRTS